MPRIAAAVAVVVLIACSIGVNVSRYPQVWEMVDPAADLSRPSESSPALPIAEASIAAQPATSPPPAPTPPPDIHGRAIPRAQLVEQVPQPVEDVTATWPARAATSAPYASRTAEIAESSCEEQDKRLVRIVRQQPAGDDLQPPAPRPADRLMRLPPVDASAPLPAGISSFSGAVPFYPTTGAR